MKCDQRKLFSQKLGFWIENVNLLWSEKFQYLISLDYLLNVEKLSFSTGNDVSPLKCIAPYWKKKQSNTFYLLWLNAPCISRPLKCRSREFSKQNFLFSKKWQKFSNNSSNQVNHQLRLWGNSPVKEFQVYKCYRNNVK